MQKGILRARKIPRNELIHKEKSQGKVGKLTFNITYYSVFRLLKSQLKELHVIIACDKDHKSIYWSTNDWLQEQQNFKIKFSKSCLKSNLVRAALRDINELDRY